MKLISDSPEKISIVVTEYNELDKLDPFLASLNEHLGGLSPQVIVSSNSSHSLQRQRELAQKYPQIHWLFNERNIGFAGARNRGLKAADGSFIAAMNIDAKIIDGSLAGAVSYLKNNPGNGLIGPRIVDAGGGLQDCCRKFMTFSEFLKRMAVRIKSKQEGILEKDFNYDIAQPVDWVIGAAMIVRREAMDKVGLLDEKYFLYVDDMDWCTRFWRSGYEVHYYPELVVEYCGTRASTVPLASGRLPGKRSWIHLRSYLRFLCKNRFSLGRKGTPHR